MSALWLTEHSRCPLSAAALGGCPSPGDRLLVLGFFLPCSSRRINVMYYPVMLTAQKRGRCSGARFCLDYTIGAVVGCLSRFERRKHVG